MKKSAAFILIFILITSSIVSAQFNEFQKFPHTQPDSRPLNGVVVTTSQNDLALIYREGKKLKLSTSDDGGMSWNNPILFHTLNFQPDDKFEIIANVTNTGRLYVMFKPYDQFPFYRIYSDDRGLTWSDAVNVITGNVFTSRYANSLNINIIIENEIWCTYQNGGNICKIVSTDNGETWSDQEIIVDIDGQTYSCPSISTLSNGDFLLTYLDKTNMGSSIFSITSNDSGKTWSESYNILADEQNLKSLKSTNDNNGNINLIYELDTFRPDSLKLHSDLLSIKSTDGINWESPQKITKSIYSETNPSISNFNNRMLYSFSSNMDNQRYGIWFGELGVTSVGILPPIIFNFNHIINDDHSVTFSIKALDEDSLVSVNLRYKINNSPNIFAAMNDDGQNGDLVAGDFIFTYKLMEINTVDKIEYSILVEDNDSNIVQTDLTTFYVPLMEESDSELIGLNNIKMPINNRGLLADVNSALGKGARYDNIKFLYSGGFFHSGLNETEVWANGVLSASRIEDYLPGMVGSPPDSPHNVIYKLSASDEPFGDAWQTWKNAVDQGAKFYDGNNDNIYNPVDLNSNGIWDNNEDRPDLIGDETYFCVYNDGIPKTLRRYDVDPLGIEIRQTIFVSDGSQNEYLKDILFIRYEIENSGMVNDLLHSVYFGLAQDHDLGEPGDDLLGSDINLQSSFCYNDGEDDDYGINSPAVFQSLLQGPAVYIPGETFIDNNADEIFTPGIDTPLDTAYSNLGPYIGSKSLEGAKNRELHSVTQYMQSHPSHGSPQNHLELRNYLLGGRSRHGDSLYVSQWEMGNGASLADTANIESRFMYSGDPVQRTGWLNTVPIDQRLITATGPFELRKNEPVEIIFAYIVSRGTSALNSITVTKEINEYVNNLYANNFNDLITSLPKENNLAVNDFSLEQNYPNPFNPVTTIKFSVPANVKGEMLNVKLIVYDLLGRKVKTLVNEVKSSGNYEVQFDASALASGVYFYQLQSGDFVKTKKLMLLK